MSLRPSKHKNSWVRVITRSRPRVKVAESAGEEQIRAREWKYIAQDLRLPQELQGLPPGSEARTSWLLNKLNRVKIQLGDDSYEYDEEDTYDDEETAEGDNEIVLETKEEGEGFDCRQRVSTSLGSIGSDGELNIANMIRENEPQKQIEEEEKVLDFEDSPGKQNRFKLVRHLRQRKQEGHSRSLSDGSTESAKKNLNIDIDQAVEETETSSLASARRKTLQQRSSTPEWMRKSMASVVGIHGTPQPIVVVDGEPLPAYLTSCTPAVAKEKPESVTMEKLKKEHEQKSMAIAVFTVTTASFILRMVSFDAFLLLAFLFNLLVCYIVRNRHSLIKKLAKNSLKRRMNFTKQVWGARLVGSREKRQRSDSAGDNAEEKAAANSPQRKGIFSSFPESPRAGSSFFGVLSPPNSPKVGRQQTSTSNILKKITN